MLFGAPQWHDGPGPGIGQTVAAPVAPTYGDPLRLAGGAWAPGSPVQSWTYTYFPDTNQPTTLPSNQPAQPNDTEYQVQLGYVSDDTYDPVVATDWQHLPG